MLSVVDFSKKSGIPRATLNEWIGQPSPVILASNIGKLAKALGMQYEQVEVAMHASKSELDQNIEPYTESKLPGEIPTFDLTVAAGGWVDIEGNGEVCDPQTMDHGLFRIRIRGDSMAPDWKDGETVEFRCLREGRDTLELGWDYYVQKRDGTATFKRLAKIADASLELNAVNRKKYRDPLHVDREDIVRMARAMGIHLPPRRKV